MATPEQLTQTYLAILTPEARAKSDAYTEGGYWLIGWGLVVAALVTWVIVRSGVLHRISAAVNAKRARPGFTTLVLAAMFALLTALLSLPWEVYSAWWRPWSYGLSKQPFMDWLLQFIVGTLVSTVLIVATAAGVYALLRKSPKRWWAWGAAAAVPFIVLFIVIAPVLIMPLFNDYKPFPQGPVRDAIVALAQPHQVPTDKLLVYDGSRQRNVVTANVAGLMGTARIAVSDLAVERATLNEVRAVVGHEIGHYVLGHALRSALLMALIFGLGLYAVHRLFKPAARWFGGAHAAADIANPATMPVLMFVVTLVMTLATPLSNAVTRWGEREADNFSLQHARDPDGLASALVKTVEYRKASPGAVEEWLFHTHPSVEKRVLNAMQWKLANTK
jgi:STE24 endopeptidase